MANINTLYFTVPKQVYSNTEGFEFLAHLNLSTFDKTKHYIYIDFFQCVWFDAHCSSPLGAIIEDLRSRNNDVFILHLPEVLANLFISNGFYSVLVPGSDLIVKRNLLSYQKFRLEDALSFQDYLVKYLADTREFPKMSGKLTEKITKSILEIFNNAHTHGQCQFVHTCGQYFPTEGSMKFSISDMGVTIRKNVNNYFRSGSSIGGKESIGWAVQKGNTTKKGDIPGGLGLSLIREFLALNEGKLQICSSNGFWEEKRGEIIAKNCNSRLIGTIVTFEFNMKDTKTYILTEEINPNNIF